MIHINVSIIIPIYNGERYLSECLDSCVNQTMKDIEIICINDGSTDATESILKKYSEK
ncbi:MAG: glycosyltransferase family 2 protein [Lachnospiraceae bacterium]|nr:glycosyltransferase family 2 protein [Lachnospiraceae bacterium]